MKWIAPRLRTTKGEGFAKAHISTAPPPPRQDARLPRAHEINRWPQGACGAPQEGTSSAYPRLARRALFPNAIRGTVGNRFRARRGWSDAEHLMLCTAPESAVPVPTSLFSSAPTHCRRAASDSASKKRSVERWCAIEFAGAREKSCAVIGWRYLQDGTSSYTRRMQ